MILWTTHHINNTTVSSDKYLFSQLPKSPIVNIDLYLPSGKIIVFEGFEQYLIIQTDYHIVKGGKGKIFDTLNVLGKKADEVCQVSFHRKGKVFQCKNKWGKEWRPLIIETLPIRGKGEKKRYNIKYSEPISTDQSLWHDGVRMPQAKTYLMDN